MTEAFAFEKSHNSHTCLDEKIMAEAETKSAMSDDDGRKPKRPVPHLTRYLQLYLMCTGMYVEPSGSWRPVEVTSLTRCQPQTHTTLCQTLRVSLYLVGSSGCVTFMVGNVLTMRAALGEGGSERGWLFLVCHLLYFFIRLRCLALAAYLFYWQKGGRLAQLWRRIEAATGGAGCRVPALATSYHRRFLAVNLFGFVLMAYFFFARRLSFPFSAS